MSRALILLVLATAIGGAAIHAPPRPAVRPVAERKSLFVEAVSPFTFPLVMSIL